MAELCASVGTASSAASSHGGRRQRPATGLCRFSLQDMAVCLRGRHPQRKPSLPASGGVRGFFGFLLDLTSGMYSIAPEASPVQRRSSDHTSDFTAGRRPSAQILRQADPHKLIQPPPPPPPTTRCTYEAFRRLWKPAGHRPLTPNAPTRARLRQGAPEQERRSSVRQSRPLRRLKSCQRMSRQLWSWRWPRTIRT